MTGPTHVGGGEPNPKQTWVGRATARPAVDPYWPPVEPDPVVVVYPAAPRRRGMRTFLIVAGVFAAFCAGGATLALISSAAVRDAFSAAPAPAVTTTKPAPPPPPGLNTPVRDGRFQFVISAVSCGHDSVGQSFVTRKAQGQFCVVDLTVENIGTKGQLFADGLQRAIGPDGTSYGPDTTAGVIANEGTATWLNIINPGNKIAGKLVYDLPGGATITNMELHDSPLSHGVTLTLPAPRF